MKIAAFVAKFGLLSGGNKGVWLGGERPVEWCQARSGA